MSAELQITAATLATMGLRALQATLRTTCLPVLSGFSVDHLEPQAGAAAVQTAPGGVDIKLPVDVFIVLDSALASSPNATPAGAAASAGQITVVLRLLIARNPSGLPTLLTLSPQPIDLGSLGAGLGTEAAQEASALQAILPAVAIDLLPQLAAFGVTNPSSAEVVMADDVVAVRFDPQQAAKSRLFPGQSWGLFIDGPTLAQYLRGRVAPQIAKNGPRATVSASYAPNGEIAHVNLDIDSYIILVTEDHFTVHFPIDLSVASVFTPVLRATAAWSVIVHGIDPFKAVQGGVEDRVKDDIAGFGGVSSGDRFFTLDTVLPSFSVLGAALRFDSARASQDGMTIGGAVILPSVLMTDFSLVATPLGKPARIQLCSRNARSGSGAPSRDAPSLANTTCYGRVEISGYGAICGIDLRTPDAGVDVRTPDASFRAYISVPPPAPETGSVTLWIAIPAVIANAMTQPLTFVLRTPRGVRLIDLGLPPKAQIDANGTLHDVLDIYVPDCLTVPAQAGWNGLSWGLDPGIFKLRPVDGPDWDVYLQAQGGLIVQLVTATGLQPGEIVRFWSATHAIDVNADAAGRVRVPVFLQPSPSVGRARMARANGQALGDNIVVQTAVFEFHAVLRGTLRGVSGVTPSGGLDVSTRLGHQDFRTVVRRYGVFAEGDLNPQPLPRRVANVVALQGSVGSAGEKIFPLPGFPESGLAIMQTADRGALLVETAPEGTSRVAGTFSGPIGQIHHEGSWAVSSSGQASFVFRYGYS